MAKKKLYIFFCVSLEAVGGAELYTAGKADYLKRNGWEVQIYSHMSIPANSKPKIPAFDEYVKNGNGELEFLKYQPGFFYTEMQQFFLKILIDLVGVKNPDEYEIIIESMTLSTHFWGEIIAQKLGARHFCTLLHEAYSNEYRENADFFYFKWKRNELISGETSCKKVFRGYKNVTKTLCDFTGVIREADPIQNAAFPIEQVDKLDWNICHIGRISKDYVPYVIACVAQLAVNHPDKTINFIFVGDVSPRKDLIVNTFKNIDNVQITALGDMFPIPGILFSKIDVVFAIAQSAKFAANEGVLTICGTIDHPDKSSGVLGYDTENAFNGEVKFSYVEVLENVLVKRMYDNKKYKLPKLRPADESYEKFLKVLKNVDPQKKYFTETITQERDRFWTAIFPFGVIAKDARIILYGFTIITKDYITQIVSQSNNLIEFGEDYIKQTRPKQYCKVVAMVDEHPEKFKDLAEYDIVGVERLAQRDYDAIVVAVMPENFEEAKKKILEIVPDMDGRIIYSLRKTRTY